MPLGAVGLALVAIFVVEHPLLQNLVGQISLAWVLGFLAKVLASKWLTTVVVADLLVSMLHHGRQSAQSLADTAEGEFLARKLDSRREESQMKLTWDDLTITQKGLEFEELMESWRWLVDDSYSPVLLSALGDFFLSDVDGTVHWLDTAWGQLTQVADDTDQFNRLRVKPDYAREWFRTDLICQAKAAGMKLKRRQCFGWKTPPVLGGEESVENLEPTDVSVHFGVLGQIHEQVKDLPPGAEIGEINLE